MRETEFTGDVMREREFTGDVLMLWQSVRPINAADIDDDIT